ncbi:MAG TPA: hypothetical protein VEB23_10095 [Ramlibacter sp.]|nr:hypothetical protein [Ramlibacter sp.]
MATEVRMVPVNQLVLWLTRLAEDHLDHGRRLQAAGVRSAIEGIQRGYFTAHTVTVDGTSARATPLSESNQGRDGESPQGKAPSGAAGAP